jgi:hypothetical protein
MPAGIARMDVPREPDTRAAERTPRGQADLRLRLENLLDTHPSSPRQGGEHLRRSEGERAYAGRPGAADATGVRESAWRAPEVQGHPDRPAVGDIHLTADRARHVLAGDGPGTPGGGHRNGTGRPGKTEFPAHWPDDKIVSTVEDVARNPDKAHWQAFNGRWRVAGERDHVVVSAVVRPDGRVWAAWPEPGGVGVTQNPRG